MKKFLIASIAVLLLTVVVIASPASAAKPGRPTTIQSGELYTSAKAGYEVIELGFDEWGYNYQAHMFEGKYCDSYRDAWWCQDYKDVNLSMKWNDAWLANTSADGDEFLDRRFGFDSYQGSGAWLTNHQSGINDDGTKWTYFIKIIAAPLDATLDDGTWYAANGTELGASIWTQFYVAQEVSNDPAADQHGAQFVSPFGPGFRNN